MSRFKKAIIKEELKNALSKHPLRDIDEEIKKDYVRGLVFIATEDENFHDDEKKYIVALMDNIGLDEALMAEFETFASDCQEDELLAFMDRLKLFDDDLKLNFLVEVIVISLKDGEFDESEQSMFDDYLDMLGATSSKQDIVDIASAIADKDTDLAISIYTAKKEFFEKFDYMFDMIDIDIKEEIDKVFSWKWTVWEMTYGTMKKDAKVSLDTETVQKYAIYLNSRIISGYFKQRAGTNSFTHKDDDNKIVLKDTEVINLEFDGRLFVYESEASESIKLEETPPYGYNEWLKENIDTDICIMEIKNTDSARHIKFAENCAGKPQDDTKECIFYSEGNKYQLISADRNFQSHDYLYDLSGEEFTFRLTKAKIEVEKE